MYIYNLYIYIYVLHLLIYIFWLCKSNYHLKARVHAIISFSCRYLYIYIRIIRVYNKIVFPRFYIYVSTPLYNIMRNHMRALENLGFFRTIFQSRFLGPGEIIIIWRIPCFADVGRFSCDVIATSISRR
jgi:hypothetical protein